MVMKWQRITGQMWRADPYFIDGFEVMRDGQWTGVVVYCAYLLHFERQDIVGREPIGPPARTLESAQRQAEIHAQRRTQKSKGVG